MLQLRPPRRPWVLMALVVWLVLLAPAGGGWAAGRAEPAAPGPGAVAGGAPATAEQALLDQRSAGSLAVPGTKRDDRGRPWPALPGVLAAAVVLAVATAVAGRRAAAGGGRRAAAPGPRAPPVLQPAPI